MMNWSTSRQVDTFHSHLASSRNPGGLNTSAHHDSASNHVARRSPPGWPGWPGKTNDADSAVRAGSPAEFAAGRRTVSPSAGDRAHRYCRVQLHRFDQSYSAAANDATVRPRTWVPIPCTNRTPSSARPAGSLLSIVNAPRTRPTVECRRCDPPDANGRPRSALSSTGAGPARAGFQRLSSGRSTARGNLGGAGSNPEGASMVETRPREQVRIIAFSDWEEDEVTPHSCAVVPVG